MGCHTEDTEQKTREVEPLRSNYFAIRVKTVKHDKYSMD